MTPRTYSTSLLHFIIELIPPFRRHCCLISNLGLAQHPIAGVVILLPLFDMDISRPNTSVQNLCRKPIYHFGTEG